MKPLRDSVRWSDHEPPTFVPPNRDIYQQLVQTSPSEFADLVYYYLQTVGVSHRPSIYVRDRGCPYIIEASCGSAQYVLMENPFVPARCAAEAVALRLALGLVVIDCKSKHIWTIPQH